MSEKEAIKDVLIHSRKKISNPIYWNKGSWEEWDKTLQANTYCAIGALYNTSKDEELVDEAEKVLLDSLPPHFTRTMGGVENFNDAKQTTHADIIDLYDRAIDSL